MSDQVSHPYKKKFLVTRPLILVWQNIINSSSKNMISRNNYWILSLRIPGFSAPVVIGSCV
jgi:hypothetical protein